MQHAETRKPQTWAEILKESTGLIKDKCPDSFKPTPQQFATALSRALELHVVLAQQFYTSKLLPRNPVVSVKTLDLWRDGCIRCGNLFVTLPRPTKVGESCQDKVFNIIDSLYHCTKLLIKIMSSNAFAAIEMIAKHENKTYQNDTPNLNRFFSVKHRGAKRSLLSDLHLHEIPGLFFLQDGPALATLQEDLHDLDDELRTLFRLLEDCMTLDVREQRFTILLSQAALFTKYLKFLHGQSLNLQDEGCKNSCRILSASFKSMNIIETVDRFIEEFSIRIKVMIDLQGAKLIEECQNLSVEEESEALLTRFHLYFFNLSYLQLYFPNSFDSDDMVDKMGQGIWDEMKKSPFFANQAMAFTKATPLFPDSNCIEQDSLLDVCSEEPSFFEKYLNVRMKVSDNLPKTTVSAPEYVSSTESIDSAYDLCEQFFFTNRHTLGISDLMSQIKSECGDESNDTIGAYIVDIERASTKALREIQGLERKSGNCPREFSEFLKNIAVHIFNLELAINHTVKNKSAKALMYTAGENMRVLRQKLAKLAEQDNREQVETVLVEEPEKQPEIEFFYGAADVTQVSSADNKPEPRVDTRNLSSKEEMKLRAIRQEKKEAALKKQEQRRKALRLFKSSQNLSEVEVAQLMPEGILRQIAMDCVGAEKPKGQANKKSKKVNLFDAHNRDMLIQKINPELVNAFVDNHSPVFKQALLALLKTQGFSESMSLSNQISQADSLRCLFRESLRKYISDMLASANIPNVFVQITPNISHVHFYLNPMLADQIRGVFRNNDINLVSDDDNHQTDNHLAKK